MHSNNNNSMATNKQVRLTPPATSRWLYGWMNYVASWMGTGDVTRPPPTEIEDVSSSEDWAEWEYVLSPSEEFLQKHNQGQMERTASELSTLRDTSSQFRLRPYILMRASEAIDSASVADRLYLLVSLDSGKRSKVIADVVKQYEYLNIQYFKVLEIREN